MNRCWWPRVLGVCEGVRQIGAVKNQDRKTLGTHLCSQTHRSNPARSIGWRKQRNPLFQSPHPVDRFKVITHASAQSQFPDGRRIVMSSYDTIRIMRRGCVEGNGGTSQLASGGGMYQQMDRHGRICHRSHPSTFG
jgi:hypothetical protein